MTIVFLKGVWGVGDLEDGMDGGRSGIGSTAGFRGEVCVVVYVC